MHWIFCSKQQKNLWWSWGQQNLHSYPYIILGLQNYSIQRGKVYYIQNCRLNLYRQVDTAHVKESYAKWNHPGFVLTGCWASQGYRRKLSWGFRNNNSAKGEYKVPHKSMAYTIRDLEYHQYWLHPCAMANNSKWKYQKCPSDFGAQHIESEWISQSVSIKMQ